jgi:hypothetical protein
MKWTVAVLALVAAGSADRAAAAGSAGTASGVEILVGGSARSLAMGGAGLADLREPGAIWASPAQLARMAASEMAFVHGMYVGGVSLEELAVGGPTPLGAFGGGMKLVRMGDINSYDSAGLPAGTVSPGQQAFSLGWAWPGGSWAAGVSGTYMRSQLAGDAKADAWAGDAGVNVVLTPGFSIAAAAQHLGTGLDYGGKRASLPMTVRGGASYAVADLGLLVAVDGVKPSDADLSVRAGAEKSLALRSDVTAAVRAGWCGGAPQGSLTGFSAGAELFWHPAGGFVESTAARFETETKSYWVSGIRVSYAWTPMGELGNAHWFSVALVF